MHDLGGFIKVRNIIGNSGNEIANQFLVHFEKGAVFQSYETIIFYIFDGKTYINKNNWKASVTTSKYRNMLLGETTKETEEKIKKGGKNVLRNFKIYFNISKNAL